MRIWAEPTQWSTFVEHWLIHYRETWNYLPPTPI